MTCAHMRATHSSAQTGVVVRYRRPLSSGLNRVRTPLGTVHGAGELLGLLDDFDRGGVRAGATRELGRGPRACPQPTDHRAALLRNNYLQVCLSVCLSVGYT